MPARLFVEAGDACPSVYELTPDHLVSLGRNRHDEIVLRDQHASRQHAEIFYPNGRWALRDRQTTNGTKLNGRRIHEPVPLENDAVIAIGAVRVRFTIDPSESGDL